MATSRKARLAVQEAKKLISCGALAQVDCKEPNSHFYGPGKTLILCLVPTKDAARRDDPLLPSHLMCTLLQTEPSGWEHVKGVHMLKPERGSVGITREWKGPLLRACEDCDPITIAAQLSTRKAPAYRQFIAEMPDPDGKDAEDYILLQALIGD